MSVLPHKGHLFPWLFPSELRWLSRRIRPFLWWHVASFLCVTASSLLVLLTPFVLKWVIDVAIPQRDMRLLWTVTVLMFLGQQGKAALTSAASYLTLSAAQKMGLRLRVDLLSHLDKLSPDYYDETPVGAAMYPLKEPVDEIPYFGSDLLPSILRIDNVHRAHRDVRAEPGDDPRHRLPFACLSYRKADLPEKTRDSRRYRAGRPLGLERFSGRTSGFDDSHSVAGAGVAAGAASVPAFSPQ